MRHLSVMYLALFLMACWMKQPESSMEMEIDPRVAPYVTGFVKDASTFGMEIEPTSLIVRVGATNRPDEIAYCLHGAGVPKIMISDTFLTYYERNGLSGDIEQVVYHELGHCLLGRSHLDTSANGRPTSVMNTHHFSNGVYNQNRLAYLNELFTRKTLEF